jgi:hypothetical protein
MQSILKAEAEEALIRQTIGNLLASMQDGPLTLTAVTAGIDRYFVAAIDRLERMPGITVTRNEEAVRLQLIGRGGLA